MGDDWRVRITLADDRQATALANELERGELDHELAPEAGERVIVSLDDCDVFLYAGTREQAERALRAIDQLTSHRGWTAGTELRRWHPAAEEWENPDAPLPEGAEELAAEREERIARERAESRELGFSQYEVRVECQSHRETAALADRLRHEGLQPLRRWRYLLVGAPDEESAQALADRLTAEAPAGSTVRVEATLAAVAAETPANPFAVFGGMGL